MKINLLIFISFFLCLVSCKKGSESAKNQELSDNIVIDLHKISTNEFHIDEIREEFPVITLKNQYPDYYLDLLERMQGIPVLDSFMIVTHNFDRRTFIYKLYNEGYISKDEFNKSNLGNLKDTLTYPKNQKFQVNAVSGFRNDKQIVIFDTNGNNDFSDDKIHEFEMDARLQSGKTAEKLANSPTIDLEYQINMGEEKLQLRRMMQIFPQVEHIHSYLLDDGMIDSLSNNYTLFMRLKDSRKGNLKIEEVDYTLALQGLHLSQIIIKPDSIAMDEGNIYFQKNFEYRIKDSIQLGSYFFKLDSISKDASKLYLNKIESPDTPITGHRIGEKIDNFSLLNLEERDYKLYQILDREKQYTLLDFWGTWCLPCIKLIPDLKNLHQEYSNKINFISVAFDDDINKVKTFTEENEMNWGHFFVNRAKRRGTIIPGLEISSYPTFILLDHDNKIIYRGGSESFKTISKILKDRT